MNRNTAKMEHAHTYKELADNLSSVFSFSSFEPLGKDTAEYHWRKVSRDQTTKPRVSWFPKDNIIVAIMLDGDEYEFPGGGILIQLLQTPNRKDLNFANCLARVFNEDIHTAPRTQKNSELWISLNETRFRRAIGRYSNFSTIPLVRWLQTIEQSTDFRYEGKSSSICVIMVKKQQWIVNALGKAYVPFAKPIAFTDALLNEKWIGAAAQSPQIGLLGVGHTGKIRGMLAIPDQPHDFVGEHFFPHENLIGIQSLLRPGHLVMVTSSVGDLYTILPNGVVFQKTQGRWHYLNYENVFSLLSTQISPSLSSSILQTSLSLSYERRGALLCILDSREDARILVSDYGKRNRSNHILRESIAGMSLNQIRHRQLIKSAARADGAVLFDREGKVIDVACMIADPPIEVVKEKGFRNILRLPGARATAAWKASLYGIAIKISEDGPVTVYQNGNIVGQLG